MKKIRFTIVFALLAISCVAVYAQTRQTREEYIEKYTEVEEELEIFEIIKQAMDDLKQNGNTVLTTYYRTIDSMQK